jgi:hypothetical protein
MKLRNIRHATQGLRLALALVNWPGAKVPYLLILSVFGGWPMLSPRPKAGALPFVRSLREGGAFG